MTPFRRALLIVAVFFTATAWVGIACAPTVTVEPEPTVVPQTVAPAVETDFEL